MARPGFTHIPLQRKKRQWDISQANPSDRSVSARLNTLILRPYISLRRAQTAESSLSAKTAIHAGRKNQSHATNALLLISSLFLSHALISDGETHPALIHWATLLLIRAQANSSRWQTRLLFCDFDGVTSEADRLSSTLSSAIWQMIRRPVRNKNLAMVNDSTFLKALIKNPANWPTPILHRNISHNESLVFYIK